MAFNEIAIKVGIVFINIIYLPTALAALAAAFEIDIAMAFIPQFGHNGSGKPLAPILTLV